VSHFVCWILHRSLWTILVPGILPLHYDAVAYCPKCDAGRGHRRPHTFPALAFRA